MQSPRCRAGAHQQRCDRPEPRRHRPDRRRLAYLWQADVAVRHPRHGAPVEGRCANSGAGDFDRRLQPGERKTVVWMALPSPSLVRLVRHLGISIGLSDWQTMASSNIAAVSYDDEPTLSAFGSWTAASIPSTTCPPGRTMACATRSASAATSGSGSGENPTARRCEPVHRRRPISR